MKLTCLGLDILINDSDPLVRCAVAKQGYKLNLLADDIDESVRSLDEYYKINGEEATM